MKGFIALNAYVQNQSQILQAARLKEELESLGADVRILTNFDLAHIKNSKICAEKTDFCVFLDKDKAAARLLEKSGVRLFNTAQAIEICDDKMLTHIALSGNGISMPDCIYAPLCYYSDAQPNQNFLEQSVASLGFPVVAKTCYGSLGAGVQLIKNPAELYEYEQKNMLTAHFYQQFIDCGGGEDVRVIVVGGKYVCAMKRKNANDFRSNIELGGKGECYSADPALIATAEKIAGLLGLDYCGIDVLTDKSEKRYICEVNSNAFFKAAESVCGINIAKIYAEHIIKEMRTIQN